MVALIVKVKQEDVSKALRKYDKKVDAAVKSALGEFGDTIIDYLKERAKAGGFPFKGGGAKHDGGTPLIDTENYIESFRKRSNVSKGGGKASLTIYNVGRNKDMLNSELGELLEHGFSYKTKNGKTRTQRAIPHIKPTERWVNGPEGQAIFSRILANALATDK